MPTLPTLPQITVDTTYPTVTGNQYFVNAGGSLQTAIDSAAAADGNLTHEIIVQAGATFTIAAESTVLRAKSGSNPSGAGWILIRSSGLASLPAPGRRVLPSDAGNMPKVATTNAAGPFWIGAEFGAHHYRFAGIEFSHEYTGSAGIATAIFQFGFDPNGNAATTLANLTKDMIFDRCYVHGTTTGNITRGMSGNVQRFGVVDCYFDEFHTRGADAQCINVWNGPGGIKYDNNFFAATGENVMFGGSPNTIPNAPLENITITRNHFKKHLKWYPSDPSYAGILWQVKNNFELKQGSKVLIEGNIFEYNWLAAQAGHLVVFTPREDSPPSAATTPAVQDITFRYNKVRHGTVGFNFLGKDNNGVSLQLDRVHIHNNLLEDISTTWGAHGIAFRGFFSGTAALGTGVNNFTIEHNTSFHSTAIALSETNGGASNNRIMENVTIRNNILPKRTNGFYGTGTSDGETTLDTYFVAGQTVYTANVMAGATAAAYSPDYAGNFFPANDAGVGFIDQAGGNYRLAPTSPFKGLATDGLDPGCEIDTLELKTAGCTTGIWDPGVPVPNRMPAAAVSM